MVRPRADNYDERRDAIIDSAAGIFAERGFNGASIAMIAARAGISKALVYHYFQSKEEMLYEMLQSHCALLVETAKHAVLQTNGEDEPGARAMPIEEKQGPEEQLKSLVRALMQLYLTSRDKHIVLMNDLNALGEDEQLEIKNLERSLVGIIKGLLNRIRPDLDDPVISSLSMYLMGAVNWTYTWFKPEKQISAGQFADLATSTFLNGIYGELPRKTG